MKTYIAELSSGLVEFMAIGTAVKNARRCGRHPQLPVQAIIREGHLDRRYSGISTQTGQ